MCDSEVMIDSVMDGEAIGQKMSIYDTCPGADDAVRSPNGQDEHADELGSMAKPQGLKITAWAYIYNNNKEPKNKLQWQYIGSGTWARTFVNAKHYITTTKAGPPLVDIAHRRTRS